MKLDNDKHLRILITGGNGYIARNLTRLFKNTTHTVYSPPKDELNLLNKESSLLTIQQFNPDIIIHTAIVGGERLQIDSYDIISSNIQMYETVIECTSHPTKIIIFGSGAEFDKRYNIDLFSEEDLNLRFPIDPYGISKNIITKQALQNENRDICILRLFGCFNYDEEPFRFIKKCILNIKNDVPIEIYQDKYMDFFYMDDVFNVVNHMLYNGNINHMNLVYSSKYTLGEIATIILDIINNPNYPIICHDYVGNDYTGDGYILNNLNLQLIGLQKGIEETCKLLL